MLLAYRSKVFCWTGKSISSNGQTVSCQQIDLEDRNAAIFLNLSCFDAIVSLAACFADVQTLEILPVHCAKHRNGLEFVVVRIGIWRLTLPKVPFMTG